MDTIPQILQNHFLHFELTRYFAIFGTVKHKGHHHVRAKYLCLTFVQVVIGIDVQSLIACQMNPLNV